MYLLMFNFIGYTGFFVNRIIKYQPMYLLMFNFIGYTAFFGSNSIFCNKKAQISQQSKRESQCEMSLFLTRAAISVAIRKSVSCFLKSSKAYRATKLSIRLGNIYHNLTQWTEMFRIACMLLDYQNKLGISVLLHITSHLKFLISWLSR